jgi:hypothetical protein
MAGNGPTGQFANLKTKFKHEIPMAVFLPTGGPVRKTISGTDCDGIREVDGITGIYEAKSIEARPMPPGQLRALIGLGDFFIGSRWRYEDLDLTAPAKSESEHIARKMGYKHNATPISAVVWAKTSVTRRWLYRYLVDSGFTVTEGKTGGLGFQFKDAAQTQKTHVFRPTDEWLRIAYIPDYYAEFSFRGNYCYDAGINF